MVTKQELAQALAEQSSKLKTEMEGMKNTIIDAVTQENEKLKQKIGTLENKVVELESNYQANMQYQRNSNVVLTGTPSSIDHSKLEDIVITIFNNVCYHSITSRDIVACHRLSVKSDKVLIKFVNSKDAVAFLDSKSSLEKLNNSSIGLETCNKFFVTDHLTPYISNLAFKCRCLNPLPPNVPIQEHCRKCFINREIS